MIQNEPNDARLLQRYNRKRFVAGILDRRTQEIARGLIEKNKSVMEVSGRAHFHDKSSVLFDKFVGFQGKIGGMFGRYNSQVHRRGRESTQDLIDRIIHMRVNDEQIGFRRLQNAPYMDVSIVVRSLDEKYLAFDSGFIVHSGQGRTEGVPNVLATACIAGKPFLSPEEELKRFPLFAPLALLRS